MSYASKAEKLSLLRCLLRMARQFDDYNIKEYAKRRSMDSFRHNRHLSDEASISKAVSDGKAQLEIATRQATLYSLYAPSFRSIMELEKKNVNRSNLFSILL